MIENECDINFLTEKLLFSIVVSHKSVLWIYPKGTIEDLAKRNFKSRKNIFDQIKV